MQSTWRSYFSNIDASSHGIKVAQGDGVSAMEGGHYGRRLLMWETAKQQVSEFWCGTPGQRFQQYYRRRQQAMRAQPWQKAVSVGLGLVLVVVGVALSIPPGVPGFLITLPGLGLLATQSRTLARWLDRAELKLRRLFSRVSGSV
jgi:hypothetical protein